MRAVNDGARTVGRLNKRHLKSIKLNVNYKTLIFHGAKARKANHKSLRHLKLDLGNINFKI